MKCTEGISAVSPGRLISQLLGGGYELIKAGHWVCEYIAEAIFVGFGQCDTEDTVKPLELQIAHAVVWLQRIWQEVWVLDSPWVIGLQWVDEYGMRRWVHNIGERIITRGSQVDDYIGVSGVANIVSSLHGVLQE